jgi:hypothetical protein
LPHLAPAAHRVRTSGDDVGGSGGEDDEAGLLDRSLGDGSDEDELLLHAESDKESPDKGYASSPDKSYRVEQDDEFEDEGEDDDEDDELDEDDEELDFDVPDVVEDAELGCDIKFNDLLWFIEYFAKYKRTHKVFICGRPSRHADLFFKNCFCGVCVSCVLPVLAVAGRRRRR